MQPINNLGYLFQHVASLLAKQSDQVLQEQLGIGFSQFKILRTLQVEPRTPQREIAFNLGQTEASVSRQVKLMIADGLLQSIRSSKDHREHITIPTTKGVRLTEAALAALAKYHHPTFAALSEKQQAQLMAALSSIHDQVCHVAHPNPTDDESKLYK